MHGTERLFLRAQMFLIHCENVYDLLSHKPKRCKLESRLEDNKVHSRFVGAKDRVILTIEQYYSMMQDSYKARKYLSTKLADHDIRKRSHFVVQLSLVKQSQGVLTEQA